MAKRLPVLTWMHPVSGGVLCRSAQPLNGLSNSSCEEDEELLLSIREACLQIVPLLKTFPLDKVPMPASPSNSIIEKRSTTMAHFSRRLNKFTNLNLFGISIDPAADNLSDASDDHIPKRVDESFRTGKLRIIDARSNLSANANILKGAGVENTHRLGGPDFVSLSFCNIANIHYVRDSYFALRSACSSPEASKYHSKVCESKCICD